MHSLHATFRRRASASGRCAKVKALTIPMARLSLTLLGGFQAQVDDGRALGLSIKKAQALLAYLANPAGKAHQRDKLAALLWGDMREPQARAGLRQVLFALRRALDDQGVLRIEGETIALDPDLVASDVADFDRCVTLANPADLQRAAELYQGDFLEGMSVEESAFEEWLLSERLRLRELALEALARLLAHQRDSGTIEPAVHTALKLLALDPLQEAVHRTLMRLYGEIGRRGAALRQYQLCVDILARELRAEPELETKALYRDMLQRKPARPSGAAPSAAAPAPTQTPMAEPASSSGESPLVAREVELAQLRDAPQASWSIGARLAAVLGEAGIGKSRLDAELAAEARRKGGRALIGRCHESEQVLPFGPWIDALRAGRVTDDPDLLVKVGAVWRAELARLLPEIADTPAAPPTSDAAQLFEAIAQLVERMARVQPVLLVLEDLHWADEMSLRLLAFIVRRLGRSRMLAVVTAREEDLARSAWLRHTLDELDLGDHLVRVPLAALSREESLTLARSRSRPRSADWTSRSVRASALGASTTRRATTGARSSACAGSQARSRTRRSMSRTAAADYDPAWRVGPGSRSASRAQATSPKRLPGVMRPCRSPRRWAIPTSASGPAIVYRASIWLEATAAGRFLCS